MLFELKSLCEKGSTQIFLCIHFRSSNNGKTKIWKKNNAAFSCFSNLYDIKLRPTIWKQDRTHQIGEYTRTVLRMFNRWRCIELGAVYRLAYDSCIGVVYRLAYNSCIGAVYRLAYNMLHRCFVHWHTIAASVLCTG